MTNDMDDKQLDDAADEIAACLDQALDGLDALVAAGVEGAGKLGNALRLLMGGTGTIRSGKRPPDCKAIEQLRFDVAEFVTAREDGGIAAAARANARRF